MSGKFYGLECLELYPEKRKELIKLHEQGFMINTCNEWLCPFNNEGVCVAPNYGDECMFYEDFSEAMDKIYDTTIPVDERVRIRKELIAKYGNSEEK